jgi:hypothetical protein
MFKKIENRLFASHLADEEKIIMIVHKHWVEILLPTIELGFFGIIMPIAVTVIFTKIFYLAVLWFLIALGIFFYALADWYFDAWLVTNISIIDTEWKGLFHRLSSRVEYDDVKEISWEVKGFWSYLLRYGDLKMNLTVGSEVVLENAYRPKEQEIKVHAIKDDVLGEQKMTDTAAIQEILAEVIKKHINENGLPKEIEAKKEKGELSTANSEDQAEDRPETAASNSDDQASAKKQDEKPVAANNFTLRQVKKSPAKPKALFDNITPS